MKKIAATCLVIICCITIVLISCKKGDNGNPPPVNPPDTSHPGDEKARFNIVASDCSTIVDSTWFINEAISNADSIQLNVNVSKTGTWSYSSDTVNGISYSGKGKLTGTGQQIIHIAASGTPAITANTLLTFKADTSKVYIYVPVIDRNVVTESVPGDSIYFKVTIDNVNYSYVIHNVDPSTLAYVSDLRHDSLIVASYVVPPTFPIPPGESGMGVQGNYYSIHTTNPTEDEFKNIFLPASAQYMIEYCNGDTRGMLVYWVGDDGISWESFRESQQEGSYFKIVGLTDGHDSKGKYFVKVKMRFQCKLYAYNTPGMKQLTNGEMVGYFFKRQ